MSAQVVIVSDIDDTLITDRGELGTSNNLSTGELESIRALLERFFYLQQSGAVIVLATNGLFSDMEKFIDVLPRANFISSTAATRLHVLDPETGEYKEDPDFANHLSSLNFSEQAAIKATQVYASHMAALLGEHRNPYKISFLFNPGTDLETAKGVCKAVSEELKNYTDMSVTLVHHDDATFYLDITPKSCTKGFIANYIASRFENPKVYVFGNGGNDASMFQEGFNGAAVANASESLLDHVRGLQVQGLPFVVAKAPRAEGVLQALNHFGLT